MGMWECTQKEHVEDIIKSEESEEKKVGHQSPDLCNIGYEQSRGQVRIRHIILHTSFTCVRMRMRGMM